MACDIEAGVIIRNVIEASATIRNVIEIPIHCIFTPIYLITEIEEFRVITETNDFIVME